MDFIALAVAVVLLALLGGIATAMAWRAAPPRPRWCIAAACFWIAACGFAVAVLAPSQMDAEGYLHEPGLPFAGVGYLATVLGTLCIAWAFRGWRAARKTFTPPRSSAR